MATNDNKPRKKPIIIELDSSEYGEGLEQRNRFWDVGKSTARGRNMWLDIETTGLGEAVTQFGPERWDEVIKKMDSIKAADWKTKANMFKALPEYEFFKNVGLAQFVTHSRGAAAPWEHGMGYTIWEDTVANVIKSNRVPVSHFARTRGIAGRSLSAALTGEARNMPQAMSAFSKQLHEATKWGRTTTARGWNVWFDVFATQAFMVQHAGELNAAGYDPFAMISATKRGAFRVESMEEHYFDMLTWRGWQDKGWAQEHLKFGKMYAAKVGAAPGSPIPIMDHLSRKAEGKGSLLRGRYGWKAELLEDIFDRYDAIGSRLKKWSFPAGIKYEGLSAHDAIRDIASEYELSRRIMHANKSIASLEKKWGTIQRFFPGQERGKVISSLAFARAGILGERFTSRGMRGNQWLNRMMQDEMSGEIMHRAQGIWGAIESQTPPVYQPGGPARVIKSPYGDYFRLLWSRDVKSEAARTAREQVSADITQKVTKAKNFWSAMGWRGKGAAVGAAAYILYNAFGRQQETISSNIPYQYQSGQQGSKVIPVPWSSPWEGISTDDDSALEMLGKAGIFAGGAYGVYRGIPTALQRFGSPELMQRAFFGARMLEDLVPFRFGAALNVSSMWSSHMTPSTYSLGIKHLTQGDMALTAVGRRYTETLGIGEHEFLRALNAEKMLGRTALEHTRVSANSPFMRISMHDLGPFDVRMFSSTSRLGNSFAGLGTDSIQMHKISPETQARRMRHLLVDAIEPHEFGLHRRALRGLHSLFPGAVGGAVRRWASIPKWDTNEFRMLQRTTEMAGKPIFVPGYLRGRSGIGRAFQGFARDATMSGYSALRGFAATFGMQMQPANTILDMAKGTAKFGAKATAIIGGFAIINNSLGGTLTDPFFNLYERAMLARASFSDMTGLTSLREQMPDIQPTAMLGVLGVSAGATLLYKYGHRAASLRGDYKRQVNQTDTYANAIWGIDERGYGYDIRERSYQMSQAKASKSIRNLLYTPEMFSAWGDNLSSRHYMQWGNLSRAGKGIVGTFAGLAALTLPFMLGSKYTREELGEIYAGNRNVEVKRGRWWELGNTPYEGGRTHYFRRHQIARRKIDAEAAVPGEGHTGLWGLIKSLHDPYWREKEAYYDRPYPITGGTFLGEIPLVGPMLDATVGRFVKPAQYMHRNMWSAGEDYEQYGGGLAPSDRLGGLASPTPRDPLGLAAQIREFTYQTTELMGLRGYLTQAIGFQKLFGGDMPFEQAAVLEPAHFGPRIVDSFWERDMGGMLGANEIYRRLYPRPERGTEVNPLRNRMPSWLPGDNYFINFKQDDPYNKVRYGGERLPGPGYEVLNPEVAGVHPEDYPAFHRYKILADVAPWAAETRTARGAAYAASKGQSARLEALDRIDREVEEVKRKKDFKEYSFLADRQTISGRVTGVGIGGEITLADYPHHTFTMSGLNMGASAVADQLRRNNDMTKEAATVAASKAAYERQELLHNMMVGSNVSISIGQGGLNAPDVEGVFTVKGRNVNRMLVDRGLAGNEGGQATAGGLMSLYGAAVEAVGHIPQKIPGPWMTMTKFFNQADPMEEYRRDVLYGSNNRFWDSPYENFIRPYLHQTISKLTPGEYIPAHVEEQRELDTYLDRIKFLKYAEGGQKGRARRTMAGGNMYGNPDMIQSALPHREKPFFEAFRQETDPRARKRILSMVSQDMQRALVGQWSKQYSATQGKAIGGTPPDIQAAVTMARSQLRKMGKPMPPQYWRGSDPEIDWKDIKAVLVQNEGADTHDFNIWDDRTNSLLRKPYVYGAVEGLTSRRMATGINAMSKRFTDELMPFESISHAATVSFTMNNNVNYAAWEREQYKSNIERLRDL